MDLGTVKEMLENAGNVHEEKRIDSPDAFEENVVRTFDNGAIAIALARPCKPVSTRQCTAIVASSLVLATVQYSSFCVLGWVSIRYGPKALLCDCMIACVNV